MPEAAPRAMACDVSVLGKGTRMPMHRVLLVAAALSGIGLAQPKAHAVEAKVHGLTGSAIRMKLVRKDPAAAPVERKSQEQLLAEIKEAQIFTYMHNTGADRELAERAVKIIEDLARVCMEDPDIVASCTVTSKGASFDFNKHYHAAHVEPQGRSLSGRTLVAAQVDGKFHQGPAHDQVVGASMDQAAAPGR